MKRSLYIFATLMLLLPFSAKGEEPEGRPSTHATLFALGRANHLDTYLSPMEYTGPQLTFLHTTLRHLKRNEHIVFETATQGEVSYTENQAQTAHYIGGSVRYDFGWGRQWRNVLWKGLELTAGGMAGGDLGFLYNDRNSNNPAQARANMRLSAAVRADYSFRIRKQTLGLHYQAQMPLVGIAFTPQYGQSYYDLFDRGHYNHNIVATHPGNALSLRQAFSLDLHIRHATLRLGYLSDLRQLKANGLRQHQYGRAFLIGYVHEITLKR